MTTTNIERRLAVTPGRAIATGYGAYVNGRAASSIECEQVDGTRPTVAYVMDEFDGGEGFANARLYTDAHNTYNACDMLPSDLLTQVTKLRAERNELVGALEDLRKYVKRAPFGTLTEADRVLAKHKPE